MTVGKVTDYIKTLSKIYLKLRRVNSRGYILQSLRVSLTQPNKYEQKQCDL